MGATRVVTAIVALIVTVCLVLTVARTAAAAGSDERCLGPPFPASDDS